MRQSASQYLYGHRQSLDLALSEANARWCAMYQTSHIHVAFARLPAFGPKEAVETKDMIIETHWVSHYRFAPPTAGSQIYKLGPSQTTKWSP